MSTSPPTPPAATLRLRPAARTDLPELIRMRIECGWNEDRIGDYLEKALPATTDLLFLFETAEGEPAGMGALELENEDPDLASIATGTVCLSWLFLYNKYQGASLGNLMVRMLEDHARALGKTTVTIHTRKWASRDWDDKAGPVSRNMQWYGRHGYVEFKPPAERYELNETTRLEACFMRKTLDHAGTSVAAAAAATTEP